MTIKIGIPIPSFTLEDQYGKNFDINSVLGKKNLVIFFYPKDETRGCIKEVCSFRDSYQKFVSTNTEVIGISSDDVNSHLKFSSKYKLPFLLLSDKEQKIRKLFNVPSTLLGLIPGRATYIVDKRGIVRYIYNSQLLAENHISESIKALDGL